MLSMVQPVSIESLYRAYNVHFLLHSGSEYRVQEDECVLVYLGGDFLTANNNR